MKRAVLMLAIGVGCTALVAAQTPTGQTTPPSSQTSTSRAGSITVTGCLQNNTIGTTGTSGTAGAAGTSASTSSRSFVLANATMGSSAPSSSPSSATSGGATAGTSGSKGTTYVLDDTSSHSDISSSNVGKKVEITGTVEPSSS